MVRWYPTLIICLQSNLDASLFDNKFCCRGTARRAESIKILSTVEKKLCNKSNGVRLVDCRMGVVSKLCGGRRRRVFFRATPCYSAVMLCPVSDYSLSVSLSVTNLSSAETAECRPRITQTKSHDDLGTLVFWGQTLVKFYRDHPQRGRQMLVG